MANEALTPYEAGYRTQALSRVFLDFAAYYNAYDHLVTSEPAAPFIETSPSRPHMLIPLVNSNLMKGEAHGLEVYADWKLTDHWLLRPGYALEELHLHLDPASEDTRSVPRIEGSVPRHWARLESHARLYRNLQWDASTAFTDRLPFQGIASWTRIDTQLSIPLAERASFSVVGQDLLRDRHLEFIDPVGGSTPSMSRRSIFGVVTWRF